MAKAKSNEPRIDAGEILGGIRDWVSIESPSTDAAAVNRMADRVEGDLRAIGAQVTRTPGRDGYGDMVRARSPWGGDGPGILVVSHLDTVHPIGTLAEQPFRREGDRIFGPGIYDMKGGAYLAYYAYRHLVRRGARTPLPITFLYVPEEEVGSPTSRAAIEAEARRNKYVLVTEPARDGGKIVTARKGAGEFTIRTRGRPSHAGLRHQDGRSAIREMAHQIIAVESLTDYDRGITTNAGMIGGGTGRNVVPRDCVAEIDLRCPDPGTMAEMVERILGLQAVDADVELAVSGGESRPPYVKDEGIAALFEHARALAADIGFELEDVPITGGCSDGNFTAAVGVPTLDGLGVDGAGAHSDHEHLYHASLEPRARLLLRLFETLD